MPSLRTLREFGGDEDAIDHHKGDHGDDGQDHRRDLAPNAGTVDLGRFDLLSGFHQPEAKVVEAQSTHLRARPLWDLLGESGHPVGVVGYCFGGAVSWMAATQCNGVAAASTFYGGGIHASRDATMPPP